MQLQIVTVLVIVFVTYFRGNNSDKGEESNKSLLLTYRDHGIFPLWSKKSRGVDRSLQCTGTTIQKRTKYAPVVENLLAESAVRNQQHVQ